jgi:hypothetical protein
MLILEIQLWLLEEQQWYHCVYSLNYNSVFNVFIVIMIHNTANSKTITRLLISIYGFWCQITVSDYPFGILELFLFLTEIQMKAYCCNGILSNMD